MNSTPPMPVNQGLEKAIPPETPLLSVWVWPSVLLKNLLTTPYKRIKMIYAMKINAILLLSLFVFFCSCNSSKDQPDNELEQEEVILVSSLDSKASNPFLTKNHLGHPVLCWTEALAEEDGFVVKYTVFDPAKAVFSDILTVKPSKGTSAHPENMNKMAFRSDGTAVAVYSRKHPTAENRFAGSLLYTQSFYQGK